MNGEEDFHVENTEEAKRSCADTCVLLLDSDDTYMVKLTEMMLRYGYRVVAATSADDLPLIISNKDKKIDLVLAEFRVIEMNKYEVLEKIRSICEIPVVAVGSYVKGAVEECLCRGAIFCLKKPLMERGLQNLWQFIARRQRDLHSEIDTNPPEKKYPITHTQSLGDELNRTSKNNEVKTEELDEYADELSLGKKRKERANTDTGEHTEKDNGCDLGDEKKRKLICADDLQNGTFEAIPNIEEANKGRKEPTEIKNTGEGSVKAKRGLVCTEEELEKWSTQPVTNLDAFVEYVFEERDFQPLESIGECVGYNEIPLSPQESSNKDVVGQLQMQKIHRALDEEVMQDGIRALDEEVMQDGIRALDEEVMQDGISLSDLEFDLQEGQGCTSDLEKKSNQELFDKIFTDLAKELKP